MNTKPSIKETMQQALDMLEKGGLNCEQEEFVAQSLRKAIADCEQAEKQEPVAIARRFHEEYEKLAPSFGYVTREDTKMFNPYSANGRLMIATVTNVLTHQSRVRRLSEAELEDMREMLCMIEGISKDVIGKRTFKLVVEDIADICGIPKGREK